METLQDAADALCSAVDGVDWNAERVSECIQALHRIGPTAAREDLDAAIERLARRVAESRVEDADGVAHAAISAGALVEWGGTPRPLGEALLQKLPEVLVAARRFADRCLPSRSDDDDPWAGIDDDQVVTSVDRAPIVRDVFRAELASDRAGGAALARLREWVLPTVAALTRDRELLARASADEHLWDLAWRMADSDASWLRSLLATQVDARWRAVLLLEEERVFELRVDGVSTNFDLHALVERALMRHGVDVPDPHQPDGSVTGALELLTWSGIAIVKPGGGVSGLPMNEVVWREGLPTDVPAYEGMRTLVLTRAAIDRSWNAARPFDALVPDVTVERELPPAEAAALVTAMRGATQ